MRELALFAGAGGGILGGKLLGWDTVCAVEINKYARDTLLARQRDGRIERFPIWDDIATFDGWPWGGRVDIITGGFPCQDISAAGKGVGISGPRSGLVFEMLRIIAEVRPRFVLAENSPSLRTKGLGTILHELANMGYDAKWGVLGAWHVGAPHRRNRMWIVAYLANPGSRRRNRPESRQMEQPRGTEIISSSADLSDTDSVGWKGRARKGTESTGRRQSANPLKWPVEPDMGRVAHGMAHRVDRVRALGNGQVPRVAALAWQILGGL